MRRATALACALIFAPGFAPHARSEELRDPTRPPNVVAAVKRADERKPQVSAIVVSSGRRIAIFNAQPVRAGDKVGIYHIDEVDVLGVRYSSSGHSEFAPLAAVR